MKIKLKQCKYCMRFCLRRDDINSYRYRCMDCGKTTWRDEMEGGTGYVKRILYSLSGHKDKLQGKSRCLGLR